MLAVKQLGQAKLIVHTWSLLYAGILRYTWKKLSVNKWMCLVESAIMKFEAAVF